VVEHAQSVAVAGEHVYWANDPPPASKPGNDLYRYSEGGLEDVSADPGEENGAQVFGVLGTSADGSVVYFAANGDLDGMGLAKAGDCAGRLGPNSMSGECNLYRWEAGGGAPSLVARLETDGNEAETDAANWAARTTEVFREYNFQKTAQVSAGGALLFRSQQRLTAYDNWIVTIVKEKEVDVEVITKVPEYYLYRQGRPLACVSCDPSGAPPSGAPDLGSVFPGTNLIPVRTASIASRNLAGNGTRAFFETTDALVAADTNGVPSCPSTPPTPGGFSFPSCLDVYEWEAAGAGSCEESSSAFSQTAGGCIYLLSTGKGKEPALFADASASGDDAYFFSRSRLVGQDKDELIDVYDVAANGGLAAQNPPAPPPLCESTDACHEAVPPAPAESSPTTPGFFGPTDPKPSHHKKHKKHQAKKHKHKAKKHKHKAKKHNKHRSQRASAKRGARR
jgi:hypothetical protein